MRALALVLAFASLGPAGARAMVAREPIRRAIHGALPDIRRCVERDPVEPGRYVMRFAIGPTGDVTRADLTEGSSEPPPAARRCLEGVFLRLRFPTFAARPEPPRVRSGGGRVSRVPPDTRRRRIGTIVVAYPLEFR